jgi:hypothetical protein
MKFKQLIAAAAVAGTFAFAGVVQAAPSFVLDLNALGAATNAYTGDGVTQNIDELQFLVANNVVNVTFFGAAPDFSLGSTFTFTDTGIILGTALLPPQQFPGPPTDYEGFGSAWTLNGAFSLSGTGKVIAVNAVTGAVTFDYTFTAGSMTLDYVDGDESINVLTGALVSGGGLVDVKAGASVSTAGGFTFTSRATDLLDGFWLQPGGVLPYLDNLTFVVADGNVDQTTTTATGARQYKIDARSDGSASMNTVPEPGSLMLAALALVAAGGVARRRRR